MKHDGVDKMFPFAKQDISEWGSKYEPKKQLTRRSYKVCRQLSVNQAPKSNCFIAARTNGAHKALFNV